MRSRSECFRHGCCNVFGNSAAASGGPSHAHLERKRDRSLSASNALPEPEKVGVNDAEQLVAQLDAAGVRKGVILSSAYMFASPRLEIRGDRSAQLESENDWVAGQVARYPQRLVGFCSFNPISEDALHQLNRCAGMKQLAGIKLHLANSGVDLRNGQHVTRLRTIFEQMNSRRLPVAIHLWTGPNYGGTDAGIFLNDILVAAPDVPVQIAHLVGAGPGYGPDAAVAVFAEAIARGDPRTRNLWFDIATVVTQTQTPEQLELIASRLRQIGLTRILFGSDSAGPFNPPAGPAWSTFQRLPLTPEEFRIVARNVAPYLH